MADDVLITKQQTLEAAIPEALRLCRNIPKSVLVHIAEDSLLREENARLKTLVGKIMQVRDQRENRLREENEQLRKALKRLLLEFDFMVEGGIIPDVRSDIIFDDARAAIGEGGNGDE